MIFPLELSGTASLISALAIGLVFGFFLEQGGMGDAQKIAGQFYLRDMAVLKIMFSAIVTASLGLFWFAKLGWLDYDRVFLLPTFVWPQVVGGMVFGAGFVVAGLCPGTSCVAAVSGRVDGAATLFGLFAGIIIFNEVFPWIEPFYRSGELGAVDLPGVWEISHGSILLLLVGVALGAFMISERLEHRVVDAG
ncbi:MAG: YeeE/YedE thiosulfate transporter family protein [Pseudomonadota bacterium]